jgi:hypothetical protein
MLGRRKAKQEPQNQEADRRRVQRGNTPQAFSYYTSRVSEPSHDRTSARKAPDPAKDKEQQPKQKRPFQLKSVLAGLPFWLLIMVAIVCAIKMLTLSESPKIVIVGENANTASYARSTDIYAAAAQKLLASSFTNRCKLTVNTDGITQSLRRDFPELVDVSMSIPLVSNRPVVYIQPAEPSVVLQSTNGNFAINSTGFVLTSLTTLPGGVPTVVDESGITPHPGVQLLPSGTVSFIQTVAYQLNAEHLDISSFVLPAGSPYELDVHLTGKPYVIKFNLEADALTQSGAAVATIQQLGGTVPQSYIDVRVPNRVYYK